MQSTSIIGDWASDDKRLAELADVFENAHPFPYVVIDNFFSPAAADRIESRFPVPTGTCSDWQQQGWHIYDNPIEGKLAHDNLEMMGNHDSVFYKLWQELQSDAFVSVVKGGLHLHPPGSRLEMHLDYSIHPISQKERRVNLIVYMNRGWKEEWGGHLALWEGSLRGLKQTGGGEAAKIAPMFNRAVLFRTSDVSWHGMPDPVECPEGQARKSVAIYYVSDARPEATPRFKLRSYSLLRSIHEQASFRPRPGFLRPDGEQGYHALCKIRDDRRLEHDDVKRHFPSFQPRWT